MMFLVSLAVLCMIYCFTNIAAESIVGQNNELISAARDGNLDAVKRLIQQGANINTTDYDEWSPLHFSVLYGHLDVVKYLIENGADIEAKELLLEETPLHFASFGGELEVAKYLAAKGANIETKNKDGETAQDIASRKGHPEVAEFLKNANENDKTTESSQMVSSPESERKAVDLADRNNKLFIAAKNGNLDAVKSLIQQGANINATDYLRWSPLHVSALKGHLDVVKYLIENGADVGAKDLVGETPLQFASLNGKLELVKYLVANGANIETQNNKGENAQDVASKEGHPEVAEYLKNATKPQQERTLILLKPETVQRKLIGKIIERFEDAGLKLVALKFIQATKEMAEEHYGHLENRTQYDEMVQYMTSGPIVPMVWEGKNAIEKTLKLIGKSTPELSQPGTIRSDFGADGLHNIIRGSFSNETANKEIRIWFNQDEIISWTAADEQWTQF